MASFTKALLCWDPGPSISSDRQSHNFNFYMILQGIFTYIHIQSSTHLIICINWSFLYRMGPTGSTSKLSGVKFCIWHKEKCTFCKGWSCKKIKSDLLSCQHLIHVSWTCRVKNPWKDLSKTCLSLPSLVFFFSTKDLISMRNRKFLGWNIWPFRSGYKVSTLQNNFWFNEKPNKLWKIVLTIS